MNERVRKRKTLWEAEGENQRVSWSGKEQYSTCDGGRTHRFSSSNADNSSLMPKDQAGWPSWESLEEKEIITRKGESTYKDGQDKPEMRERSDNKNSYKSRSPGFDGWDRRKHDNSPDDGQSRSRRYLEGGRNRSRDRGRSRSPSWNRSKDRNGMRGRSRSRSKNRKNARGQTRSRSPIHECRHESHGWNERSESGISSQACRDFVAGNCRRGSQCRFFHPDSMVGNCLENDHAERWRSRPDHGHTLTCIEEPARQSWDKVSGSGYGEDDSRTKSRGAICCKDFMRGKCKWGASCRFSHHVDSGDINDKGYRDRDHQASESRKPLCKYFLAGKCHRDNCWFSHDAPRAMDHENRPHDEGGCQSLAGKNGWWSGPKWDQEEPESNIAKGTGWSGNVANKNTADDAIPVEMSDNRWDNERRTHVSPEWKEKPSENNNYLSTPEWKQDNGGDMVAMKSTAKNSNGRQEYPLISQGLESQNLGVISAVSHAPNITPEVSSLHLSEATMHEVSLKSDIQQHPMVLEDNVANTLSFNRLVESKENNSFNGLVESKENKNSMNTVFMPGQSLNPNNVENLDLDQRLVSVDQRDNLFFQHPSKVRNFDLNGPNQALSSSLNLQSQTQSHQKEAAKTPEVPDFGARQSFYNDISSGQAAQILFNPASASSMQKFVHEQAQAHPHTSSMQKFVNEEAQAHPHTTLNSLTSTGVVTSLEANPTVRSPDQLDPLGDGRGNGGNDDQTTSEFPYSFEQKNQILFEEFSPMSGDNPEFENALPSVSSKVQCPGSPKLKLQETPATLEVKDNNTNSSVECEKGQEDTRKENEDGHGRAENGAGNKDDKDMRLFKNALVEFVKDILKPKWKEGRMSREVHKTIVKKVVDKVSSTIQCDHIPKTQDRIDQYLSHSKTKIAKLVLAYVERHLKTDS